VCRCAAHSNKLRDVVATRILPSVFCILFSALCYAEALPDPTRPPAEFGTSPTQAGSPQESGLQSLIISTARRAAIINGNTVELGGKLGDSKLVEISESSVVLQGPQGRRTLALFPEVGLKKKLLEPELENKPADPAAKKYLPARKANKAAAPEEKK
jgi:MSHA biogenesis protein MshK